MSEGSAREQWARHVREALQMLDVLEGELGRLGGEGRDVAGWVRALWVAKVLLEEEAERLGRAELGLSTPEPLRHRQCKGGRRWV